MCWLWICRFLLISTGIIYGYYAMILKVDEEDFGGHGALLQEGLFASISLFLVLWSLSLSHTHTQIDIWSFCGYIYERERGFVLCLTVCSCFSAVVDSCIQLGTLLIDQVPTIQPPSSLSLVMYEQSWLHYTPWLVPWEQREHFWLSFAFFFFFCLMSIARF